jgi:hypothetical protein
MRSARIGLFVCFLLFSISLRSQQVQTTPAQSPVNPQGAVLLQQAVGAVVGNKVVSDVTLNGTATRVAGSENDSGDIELEAMASGQSLLNFTYGSGKLGEVRSISSSGSPVGSWTGPDGKTHPMSYHNLLTDSSWFFPALTLGRLLASPTNAVALNGQEAKDGISVTHLTTSQQFSDVGGDVAALMQHLSQTELFLEANTLLPVALEFNIHPDNNAGLDIPVEVRFSDYRTVNGVQIPFHVQKFLNNSLMLDIQLQTATLNSGLAASAFAIQ